MIEEILNSDDPALDAKAYAAITTEEKQAFTARLSQAAVRRRDEKLKTWSYIRTPSPYPDLDESNEQTFGRSCRQAQRDGRRQPVSRMPSLVARGDCRNSSNINIFILLREARGDPLKRVTDVTAAINLSSFS